MQLHHVPNNTKVKLLEDDTGPPGAVSLKKGDIIEFGHIDGMYSFCRKEGVTVHLKAWTEVEIVENNDA